jgi:hypothetical protein
MNGRSFVNDFIEHWVVELLIVLPIMMLIVNRSALFILCAKPQQPRECHVDNGELVPLRCPSDGVLMSIKVIGAMDFSQYLLFLIVAKAHKIKQTHLLALLNDFIEHWVVELLIVLPINEPHLHNRNFVLIFHGRTSYHCEIEVMMKVAPKP